MEIDDMEDMPIDLWSDPEFVEGYEDYLQSRWNDEDYDYLKD